MFYDRTDFNHEDWNGWQRQLGEEYLRLIKQGDGLCLEFPRQPVEDRALVLAHKEIVGLEPGVACKLSIRMCVGERLGTGIQKVWFEVDGVRCESWVVSSEAWRSFQTSFEPSKASHQVSLVYQHTTASEMKSGNFVLDDLKVTHADKPEDVVDVTDFQNKSWNDWQKGANGAGMEFIEDHERNISVGYPVPTGGTVLGTVLHKQVSGLVAGDQYDFSLRVRQAGFDVAMSAHVGLEHERAEIGRWPLTWSDWQAVQGRFTAGEAETNRLAVTIRENPDVLPRGVLFDDIVISAPDVTDFSGADLQEQLNGWVLGETTSFGAAVTAESGEGNVLNFPTHGNQKSDGVILSKDFPQLENGARYEFMMRARSINNIDQARLSVAFGTKEVIPETIIRNIDKWEEFLGEFTKSSEDVKLQVSNHNPESRGNDYRFSVLRCRRID